MGEAAAAEQNSVILSQVWEDPQRSNCRTEVSGLGWCEPRWIKNSKVYVLCLDYNRGTNGDYRSHVKPHS